MDETMDEKKYYWWTITLVSNSHCGVRHTLTIFFKTARKELTYHDVQRQYDCFKENIPDIIRDRISIRNLTLMGYMTKNEFDNGFEEEE